MNWTRLIEKLVNVGSDDGEWSEQEAYQLFAAMLDGGIAELELGALIALLQRSEITLPQLLGFHHALLQRTFRLVSPAGAARTVVVASYCGTQEEPNLLPLMMLVLQRLGVPVLIHGALSGEGRVQTAYVLRELGVMPVANLGQAQARLDERKIAFVPTALLAPGLAELIALKGRLGLNRVGKLLAKLLNPLGGESLVVVAADDAPERGLLRELLQEREPMDALLLDGTEGEAFANPRCRPRLEHVVGGISRTLFDAETIPLRNLAALPVPGDAANTARWTRRVLDGQAPLPLPLVNQIACCLYGAGYTDDLNQAKAIVAVETGSLIAA
ncbi:MAG: DNA-binding protein YbiB [Betaproteobacteria bacterium]|nr:DNA-binding protein YbiB [Betaproteobacteria bacterium]